MYNGHTLNLRFILTFISLCRKVCHGVFGISVVTTQNCPLLYTVGFIIFMIKEICLNVSENNLKTDFSCNVLIRTLQLKVNSFSWFCCNKIKTTVKTCLLDKLATYWTSIKRKKFKRLGEQRGYV